MEIRAHDRHLFDHLCILKRYGSPDRNSLWPLLLTMLPMLLLIEYLCDADSVFVIINRIRLDYDNGTEWARAAGTRAIRAYPMYAG